MWILGLKGLNNSYKRTNHAVACLKEIFVVKKRDICGKCGNKINVLDWPVQFSVDCDYCTNNFPIFLFFPSVLE